MQMAGTQPASGGREYSPKRPLHILCNPATRATGTAGAGTVDSIENS
jgi:hypothetical protein